MDEYLSSNAHLRSVVPLQAHFRRPIPPVPKPPAKTQKVSKTMEAANERKRVSVEVAANPGRKDYFSFHPIVFN